MSVFMRALFFVAALASQRVESFVATTSGKRPVHWLAASAPTSSCSATELPWILDTERYGPFQQDRDWGFVYSSVIPAEACTTYEIDTVQGTVPSDLRGTYYKIGPGNFERGGQKYAHVLDGDGFVAAFRFEEDSVSYTGRFVETEFFLDEQADDEIKYRSVFGTQRPQWIKNVLDLTLKNVANTNVLAWGGRVLALFEAGIPYELDPRTLATISPASETLSPYKELGSNIGLARGITVDQGGPIDQLLGTTGKYFTAHPHVLDEDTIVAFLGTTSVQDSVQKLEFVEYNRQWARKSWVLCTFPRGPSPHDFAVSDSYYIFFQNPFGEMDNLSYAMGLKGPAQIMQLQLRQPTILRLVNRETAAMTEIDLPSYFNIHMVPNAIETKDGKLIVYSNGWDLTDDRFFSRSEETVPFLGAWGGLYPDFTNGRVPPSYLYRTVIDLTTFTLESHAQVAPGHVIEFPTQYQGAIYCSIASANDASIPGSGFCRYNLDRENTVEYWWAPHRVFTGELHPVPKKGAGSGCWLLGLLYDAGKQRTSLAVFDSERFTEGPVCQLHLRHHLTYGLHGGFAEESQ